MKSLMKQLTGIKQTNKTSINKQSKSYLNNVMPYHLMLVIPVIITFIFCYIPMAGTIMAFQNYHPGRGFLNSAWVGLDNFKMLFALPDVMPAFRNTLVIAIGKIIANLIIPIIFALLLNEVRIKWFKRGVQTITYLPYFLSWVVLSGILIDFLSPGSSADSAGLMNSMLHSLGIDQIVFLGDKKWFSVTIIVSAVWTTL